MYFSTPTADENKGYAAGCLADIALAQKESGLLEEAASTMNRALALCRTISKADNRSSALKAVSIAQARFGDYSAARQTLEAIERESDRRWAQKDIAEIQARAGFAIEAVRTVEAALIEREKLLDELAKVFTEIGDREGLKRLLQLCARDTNGAHRLCMLLARLYPDQLYELTEAVIRAEP